MAPRYEIAETSGEFGVVPAKAGTHNHGTSLLRQAGTSSVPYDYRLWVWVPDRRSLRSLVRDDGVLLFDICDSPAFQGEGRTADAGSSCAYMPRSRSL